MKAEARSLRFQSVHICGECELHLLTLQQTATHTQTPDSQETVEKEGYEKRPLCRMTQRSLNILRRNTLQQTATDCNGLQHSAVHCTTLQQTATNCNRLEQTATDCNRLQQTATDCNILQHVTAHCATLQHTAALRTLPKCLELFFENSFEKEPSSYRPQ